MCKISVIIPVYNMEKYLQECIDCLKMQTIKESIEYIFVNDASTDSSYEILKKNEVEYPNMRVINSEKNLRQGGARNIGIANSNGEYIGFVDPDDLVAPSLFETLYSGVQNGEDASFVQYAAINSDETIENILNNGGVLH